MWLFTKYGFFSVVSAKVQTGAASEYDLVVRARSRKHLENLQTRFRELKRIEIFDNAGTDYQSRITVNKYLWADIMSTLTMEEIDYTNFKNKVGSGNDPSYTNSLHDVWSVMHAFGNGVEIEQWILGKKE